MSSLELSKNELTLLLQKFSCIHEVYAATIASVPFLCFDAEKPLDSAVLTRLMDFSHGYMLFEKNGELLRPLDVKPLPYMESDLAEVLKYKGKTSVPFTKMMLNLAMCASTLPTEHIPTVLDPMSGKATTGLCAMERGWNSVGLEISAAAVEEVDRYLQRYFQLHRLKHTRDARSLTAGKTAVREIVYTAADSKEHFSAGDTRTVSLCIADTALAGDVMKKRPADLLVTDLPYGVQHATTQGGKTEPFDALLRRALPSWFKALKPGAGVAISYNTLTLKREKLLQLLSDAGFVPMTGGVYDTMVHEVEQAVLRDAAVAVRP